MAIRAAVARHGSHHAGIRPRNLLPVPIEEPVVPLRRGFRWGALFWTALAGWCCSAPGSASSTWLEDLFAATKGLGFLGLAFRSAWLRLALGRHRRTRGVQLARLATIEKLHRRAG